MKTCNGANFIPVLGCIVLPLPNNLLKETGSMKEREGVEGRGWEWVVDRVERAGTKEIICRFQITRG